MDTRRRWRCDVGGYRRHHPIIAGHFDRRARWLAAFFSYRVATRRYCLIFDQNRSHRFRSRYRCRSTSRCSFRPFCVGITASAPRRSTSSTSPFLSAPLVRDHRLRLMVGQQRLGLGDVRLLGRRQDQLDGVPSPMSKLPWTLVPEAAPAPAEGLLGPAAPEPSHFFRPGGLRGGRGRPSSRGSAGRGPGSRAAARIRSPPWPGLGPAVEPPPDGVGLDEPLGQVSPGDAGAADVQDGVDEEPIVLGDAAVQPRGASGIRSLIRSQSASAIACRGSIGGPPWRVRRAAGYPRRLSRVHTA